jgi:hypothetical protein
MSDFQLLRGGLETASRAANEAQKTASLVSQLLRAGHTAKATSTAATAAQHTATTAFLIGEYLSELESLEKEAAQ